jgi:hypothetical protein
MLIQKKSCFLGILLILIASAVFATGPEPTPTPTPSTPTATPTPTPTPTATPFDCMCWARYSWGIENCVDDPEDPGECIPEDPNKVSCRLDYDNFCYCIDEYGQYCCTWEQDLLLVSTCEYWNEEGACMCRAVWNYQYLDFLYCYPCDISGP